MEPCAPIAGNSERPLMSIFGPVRVARIAYGARHATNLHPLDAALKLPGAVLSWGAPAGGRGAAKTSFR